LVLCRSEHGLEEEAHAAAFARELGIAADVLGAADVAALEPGMRMTIAGGVRFSGDAHLVPAQLMAALQREAVRLGVELRHGVDARRFRVDGARIAGVETSTGIVKTNEYVLCAGVWSTKLARLLGLPLPMQAGRGYSLTLEKVPGSMRGCAILSEARASVTPMGASLRVGGTMEITGIDETVEPARIRGIVKSIGTYLPDMTPVRLAQASVRTGLRPCSPDGLPYLGR